MQAGCVRRTGVNRSLAMLWEIGRLRPNHATATHPAFHTEGNMTTDTAAAIERLRKFVTTDGFIYDYEQYLHDLLVTRDLYLAEHTADEVDEIVWHDPPKTRVPNPLDDDLREARRLLEMVRDYMAGTYVDGLSARVEAFLTRTSYVEPKEQNQ